MLRDVRELMATGGITDDVDVRVGRGDPVVADDAAALDLDLGGIETEAVYVRGSASGEQHVRSGDNRGHPVRPPHRDADVPLGSGEFEDRRAEQIADALALDR